MAIIIGIKYNHIEREGALTFRVNFVSIRGQKKRSVAICSAPSYCLIVLLSYLAKLTALVSLMTVILI